MWNTVLFDLDGTLTDSGEGITRSVQYALEKGFGIVVDDPEELRSFVGPPLREKFMSYAGLSREQAEEAIRLYRERYTEKGMFENSVYEGVRELLKALKQEHFTVALTSSKPEVYCRQILEHFDLLPYFDLVCGSELDGGRSEKSELIRTCLDRLGMTYRGEEAVIVGDREYDIVGAKQTGIGSVGVTYGYGPREELEAVWPDVICDSAYEVRNVLIGQARDGGKAAGLVPYMKLRESDGSVVDLRRTGAALACDGSPFFRIWRCLYPLLVDFAGSTALSYVCAVVIMALSRGKGGLTGSDVVVRYAVLVTLIADAALLPLFVTMHRRDEEMRRFYGAGAFRIPARIGFTVKSALFCAAAAVLVSGPLELVVSFFSRGDTAFQEVEEMIASPGLLLQILAVGIVGPVMEEYLFRGILFRRLRDYVGMWWGVILSAVIFGIAHGNLTQGLFAGAFGIMLALLYEHYGTLRAPIAAHIANNVMTVLVSYFLGDIPLPLWLLYILGGIAMIVYLLRRLFLQKDPVNVV